jgi:Fic family protein
VHEYDYDATPRKLLTPEVVRMLASIHEHKGKQELFVSAHADVLSSLLEIAKIQSTDSSNRIEGIHTTDKRLRELVAAKATPRNRSEQEIAGYRDALATIHESYEHIEPRPNVVLQLHRQIYSYASHGIGGAFKNSDNRIVERDAQGVETLRFAPVPAFLTATAVEDACRNFETAIQRSEHDALVLIPMFILDFLCIHPFNDGNGRLSRLLSLLLYYRAGYIVGKYISMERLIEKSKDTHYDALQASSVGWHDGANDYLPFLRYCLGVLEKAYAEFEQRVEHLQFRRLSKPERIKAVIDRSLGTIAKRDIVEACPDISLVTVERTLATLVKSGALVKVGSGRASAYAKKTFV